MFNAYKNHIRLNFFNWLKFYRRFIERHVTYKLYEKDSNKRLLNEFNKYKQALGKKKGFGKDRNTLLKVLLKYYEILNAFENHQIEYREVNLKSKG